MTDRYRELIASLPLPTAEQTEGFAVYMVGAHSWYKMKCDPPGETFAFYLDPNAGRTLARTTPGRAEYRDRVDGHDLLHHSSMPTTEYRERFGHWDYASLGPRPVVDDELLGPPFGHVRAPEGGTIAISPELLAAGTVSLTAYVHSMFVPGYVQYAASMFRAAFEANVFTDLDDPYVRNCRRIIELSEQYAGDPAAFDRLAEAERARQRAGLRAAMLRVREQLMH